MFRNVRADACCRQGLLVEGEAAFIAKGDFMVFISR